MANHRMRLRGAAFCAFIAVVTPACPILAGDLTPPAGPVAPTMKPLTQVEPRIAVNAANTPGDATTLFRISQPGSYYLTGNISGSAGLHGITIATQGVTLDLMGFTLTGFVGSLDAIFMQNFRDNVVIRNGHIRAWGGAGVTARIDSGRIEHLTVHGCGSWGIDQGNGTFTTHLVSCEVMQNGSIVPGTGGIRVGEHAIVTDCMAHGSTGTGFTAAGPCRFERCQSSNNVGDGFNCPVQDVSLINCSADSTIAAASVGIRTGPRAIVKNCSVSLTVFDGILVGVGSLVSECTVFSSQTGHGINANGQNCIVENCTANVNSQSGIRTADRCMVRGCATNQNGQDNITVGGSSSVINCTANGSTAGHGINASFTQSLVQGCTANSNAQSGVRASQRTRVQGCVCSNNTFHGVHATFVGTVEDCFLDNNSGDGILMDAGGCVTIRNNTVSEHGGTGDAGIRVTSPGLCHIEGNHVSLCASGIVVTTGGNTVVRNGANGNATNYTIAAGNTAGPIVTSASAATATNPLANYSN